MNKYVGTVTNIRLVVGTDTVAAPSWLTETSVEFTELAESQYTYAQQIDGQAAKVQKLITGGAGSLTLAQVQTMGYISSAERAMFEGALANLGYSSAQIAAMNLNQVKKNFTSKADQYRTMSLASSDAAVRLVEIADMAAGQELSTKQSGFGFTPIFGVSVTPVKNMTVGLKYEMKTRIQMTNNTESDDFGVFPDQKEITFEIPAILAIGIGYKPVDWIEGQFSFTTYFNKAADWGYRGRFFRHAP